MKGVTTLVVMRMLKLSGRLQDRKKYPAGDPVFRLASVDLLELDAPTTHLARFLPSLTCGPPDHGVHVDASAAISSPGFCFVRLATAGRTR